MWSKDTNVANIFKTSSQDFSSLQKTAVMRSLPDRPTIIFFV